MEESNDIGTNEEFWFQKMYKDYSNNEGLNIKGIHSKEKSTFTKYVRRFYMMYQMIFDCNEKLDNVQRSKWLETCASAIH